MTKYMQGRFKPKNPQKYMGDPTNIIYRSSWEFKVFRDLDRSENILQWGSEEIKIGYISPIDNRPHTYYPDLVVLKREPDNSVLKYLIEIKPYAQTKPPMLQEGKRRTKSYINAVQTWGVNQAKWHAAEAWCSRRGIKFEVWTEKELFGH